MPYHQRTIPKGTVGEVSKIEEELAELKDALEQNNQIMALVELSDLIGAIQLFLENKYPQFTMEHLNIMSKATMSAFREGTR